MAGVAIQAQGFVLEHERPALHGVTLEAGVVTAHNIGAAALHRGALVRIVAGGAAHLALEHGMMMRQTELRLHIEVALETGLRVLLRVHDLANIAAALHMQTAGPMTRLAANVLVSITGQPRMRRGMKIAHDITVTGVAAFRADECCAGDSGRRHECARGTTGNENQGERSSATHRPPEFFALAVDPSSYSQMPHGMQCYQKSINLATHFYENCAEHQEPPKRLRSMGSFLHHLVKFQVHQDNTLLVRALCLQAMTLIVVIDRKNK